MDLSKLNKEQKEAVAHKEGPLLIVAGAGTGKTTVLTQRIAYLIDRGKAKSEEILAVTFTEKAAAEMEERVDKLLPMGYVDLWISTFHAFCERVLRDHALDIGLPADFKILDQTSGWLLVYKNFDKFQLDYYKPLGNPTKFIQALISHFSHCKDQAIYPEDYLEYGERLKTRDDAPEAQETERIKEVAGAYHAYQKLLLENSALDFGDLINYCLKLFQKRKNILKKYREQFKYILVDEFQDTNWAQYELIKILAAPKNNLAVCADDDQAIYRWRGASFSNIIQFKKDFLIEPEGSFEPEWPKAAQISLVQNYRSCQNILDLAYKFIKANDPDRLEFVNKISKKLVSKDKCKGEIEHIGARTLEEEVRETVKKIIGIMKKDKEASYNDFAILVRANDAANPFIKALERSGLPYQFLASRGLYSKPAVLDAISYFKLLDNYHESPALYRILNMPFLEISPQEVMQLTQYAHYKTKSLYQALEESALVTGILPKSQERIGFILSMIKRHSLLAKEKPVSEILVAFLNDSGYLKYLTKKDDKPASALNESKGYGEAREQLDLLNQFYKRVKNFEESTIEPNLNNFMRELSLEIDSGEEGKLEFDPEQGPDMIKVMTIHGAKGLEFKYVFLANMVDKRFPTIERKDLIELPADLIKDIKPKGDIHLQEERRLCYVAMTRAKRGLYFTTAEDYGGARKKKLSRFLTEMGYQDKSEARSAKLETNQKLEILNRQKVSDFGFRNSNLKEKYLPSHFSYSQLAAFEKCPLQYKFAFILKVPVKGKAVFSFGKTMHAVLYQFLKQASEGIGKKQDNLFGMNKETLRPVRFPQGRPEGIEGRQAQGKFADLEQIYEKNWLDEWYESKKQKEDYYKLGKKIIGEFYEEFANPPAGGPPKVLKINGAFALEMPFNLKVAEYKLFGVIDRIDEKEGGVVIFDYKTGAAKDKLDPGDKEQLLIYQMAAEEIFKLKTKELVYHYLNENKKASFLGSEKEKSALKEKIISEIEEIKSSDFKPTPGWQCAYCDFKDICDQAER